jgi:hypothetical protein
MHAQHKLPYASAITWTLCGRHVERRTIAAFEEGVTCKACQKAIEWSREAEERGKSNNRTTKGH